MKTQHHKTLRIAAALALMGMLSGQASAIDAQSNNTTADVTVRLIQPISIQKTADLNFGTLLSGEAVTVVFSAATGILDAGNRGMPSVGDVPQLAKFTVSGEPHLIYGVATPSLGTILTNADTGETIVIEIDGDSDSFFSTGNLRLNSSGTDNIRIGGSFQMTGQSRGVYTAPSGIDLTVYYD